MIAFKDFKKIEKMGGLSFGPFQTAVDAANQWISSDNVQIVNVETLSDTGGVFGISSTSQDGIRVWYKV